MKKTKFLYLLLAIGCVFNFTACNDDNENDPVIEKTATIDFENIALPSAGFVNNQKYEVNGIEFSNKYTESEYGGYWEGFSYSQITGDTTSETLQYSVYAESGAEKSKKFAISYASFESPTNFKFIKNEIRTFKSVMVNNSTNTALSIKNGDHFSKQFEANDWFKVIFTGYDINSTAGKTVEYYLADYRNNKTYICNQWTKVNLEPLGKVNKITVTFDSSDKGEFGVNTPQYVCIDNLVYIEE